MTTINEISIIPFNKLTLWKGNVRKTGIETGLDELTASISAHGLLNPLTVRPAGKGKYAVVAGQRRFLALQRLVQAGAFAKTTPLACTFAAEDADPAELSLAENVVRVAMHPADQFDAWRELIEKGASVAGIAERFGVQESTVKQRLALGRVSPRIFGLYREGTITLEVLQAFTVTDDHALQEVVWDGASGWQKDDARHLRRALTQADVSTDDRRVRFVTVEVYEAAGGTIRRDLFDAEGGGFVQDVALLDRLTREKLEEIAATVKAEGWKWTEGRVRFDYEDRQAFERRGPVQSDLAPELDEERDLLVEEYNALSEREDNEDAEARCRAIDARLDEIEALSLSYPDTLKAHAGAVVFLSYDGTAEIDRGLMRPEDGEAEADEGSGTEGEVGTEAVPASSFPAYVIRDLTAHKTAALRIETARNPEIALALAVHCLAKSVFYTYGQGSVLKASLTAHTLKPSILEHDTCPAVLALEAERERLADRLPGDYADLWKWCLDADRDTLLDVLAVTVAHGIDAVESKADSNEAGRRHGEALAQAVKLDMTQWYCPTAAGYFSRVTKAQILTDLEAARQAPAAPSWAKMKKTELAELAERETAERGWLPSPLQ